MAEHPNVSLLKNGYEAFNKGEVATVMDLFTEDAVWHVSGTGPLSGEHRGRNAVFAIFSRLGELSRGTFQAEVHDLLANDEHGVAVIRVTGSRPGQQLDLRGTDIFHVRGGKITEFWSFFEDPRAWDEFWS